MSRWGLRPEFKERELRKAVDVVAKELMRQLGHGLADPDLSNFLTKSTRHLTRQAHRRISTKGVKNQSDEEKAAQASRMSILSP